VVLDLVGDTEVNDTVVDFVEGISVENEKSGNDELSLVFFYNNTPPMNVLILSLNHDLL